MQGIARLKTQLGSEVRIRDVDIDNRLDLDRRYGLALFLGTLYHLKNPFGALERLARHARYCVLSTRVARLAPDRRTRLDALPVASLLEPAEINADTTNYFIFSPPGLEVLVRRAGWTVLGSLTSGAADSDPVSADERMYLLLENAVARD